MKMNISLKDYTYKGLGFNSFNFINNVSCDLSNWLLENYQKNRQRKFTKEEEERYSNLLKQIIDLINSEEINE